MLFSKEDVHSAIMERVFAVVSLAQTTSLQEAIKKCLYNRLNKTI